MHLVVPHIGQFTETKSFHTLSPFPILKLQPEKQNTKNRINIRYISNFFCFIYILKSINDADKLLKKPTMTLFKRGNAWAFSVSVDPIDLCRVHVKVLL